jgi:hypothetical protein
VPLRLSRGLLAAAGGTSASAPLWAGLIALADQYAHHDLGLAGQPKPTQEAKHALLARTGTLKVAALA